MSSNYQNNVFALPEISDLLEIFLLLITNVSLAFIRYSQFLFLQTSDNKNIFKFSNLCWEVLHCSKFKIFKSSWHDNRDDKDYEWVFYKFLDFI